MNFCTLNIKNNNCPHVSKDGKHCLATETKCSFSKQEGVDKYVRKSRWYEQYYK